MQRALQGAGQSGADRQLQMGCFVPIALAVAMLVATGVLMGLCMQPVVERPAESVTVRVINDGGKGGPSSALCRSKAAHHRCAWRPRDRPVDRRPDNLSASSRRPMRRRCRHHADRRLPCEDVHVIGAFQ